MVAYLQRLQFLQPSPEIATAPVRLARRVSVLVRVRLEDPRSHKEPQAPHIYRVYEETQWIAIVDYL